MKKVLLTGGTGFLGFWLLKELVDNDVFVYAVVRKGSAGRERLRSFRNIEIIELDMDEICSLPNMVKGTCDVFYHLAWEGVRNDVCAQMKNIGQSVNAVCAAKAVGCKRIIITGSQAEYGLHTEQITEESATKPNTAYGASKLAACNLTRVMAEQMEIEWTWVRVFSLYGLYDHPNTMVSYALREYANGEVPKFTKAEQQWDYLYVTDAVKALLQLGTAECSDTVYNLAYGKSAPLKEFIKIMHELAAPTVPLMFGEYTPGSPIVNLDVSIHKIIDEIKWVPKIDFTEGIRNLLQYTKIQEVSL